MVRLQPFSSKFGEVKFRKKLVKQHLGKEGLIPQEPDKKEILNILRQRVSATENIFKKLDKKGISLSPFLEIGAEKGQRSMVLVNNFKAKGFASDLSFESLASASKFARILGFKKLPYLLCCDAYHLPFADETFPFIFCFETLHHFPDPTPIVKEIYRVLAPGGFFYWGEEPLKQTFNLGLWRRGYHLNTFEKLLKLVGILPFISKIGKTEVTHGILEEEFSLKTWKEALSVFEKVEATIKPVFFGPNSSFIRKQNAWKNPGIVTRVLTALQGGGIEGLGVKKGRLIVKKDIERVFICPDCGQATLKKEAVLVCLNCKRNFGPKNGVLMLLSLKLQKKLYG